MRESVRSISEMGILNAIQFSGNESPEDVSGYRLPVLKAIHISNENSLDVMRSYQVDAFLLDTHRPGYFGGTGKTFDWMIGLKAAGFGKVILAGGLTPDNVASAVAAVHPYGIDVSSGIEVRPGIKDHKKIRDFILRAREAESSIGG